MGKKVMLFDSGDIVGKYFKEIKKSNSLSQKEEIELCELIAHGDENAIDKLVFANLKFVVSIAKQYQGQGLSLEDLISEGNLGLVKAATKFDYTKGVKFISYAVWWIKESIKYSLNNNARIVRLPTNIVTKVSHLSKELTKMENAGLSKEVFELKNENKKIAGILGYNKHLSLNEVINDDGNELIDNLTDNNEEEEQLDETVNKELFNLLNTLGEREKNMVLCYFGINTGCEAMTLEAIGEKYGLTKERIRQLISKSIRQLRNSCSELQEIYLDYMFE